MDRLEAMSTLAAVVDQGSFTAASRVLGVPLASVSRKVADLEAHLGARLLTRSTRRLALTDAGVAYLAIARRILEDVSEAERVAMGEYQSPRGELTVTAPILFGRLHIIPIVTEFLAAYPDINVRLLLSDRNLHLIEDHVDLGVRIGRLADSELIATRVGLTPIVVCAAPSLLERIGAPRHPSDLAGAPCIGFDPGPPSTVWTFRTPEKDADLPVSVTLRLSTTTAEAAVDAAVAGAGFVRVRRYQVHQALASGALTAVLENFEPDLDPIHLIHASRERLPLKTRTFLSFTAERLRRSERF